MEKKTQIQRICRHEVGHFIAAREMGFTTHAITATVALGSGHRATSEFELWTPRIVSIPTAIEYIRKRLIVIYAGVVAESLDENDIYDRQYAHNEWHNGGAMDDYAKIRELTQLLRNLMFPDTTDSEQINDQLKSIGDAICQETGELLIRRKGLVVDLNNAFLSKFIEFGKEFELTEGEMKSIQSFKDAYS